MTPRLNASTAYISIIVSVKNGTVESALLNNISKTFAIWEDIFCDQNSAARAIWHVVPRENTVSRGYILHRFGGTICFVISVTHAWHSCERIPARSPSAIRLLKTRYLTTWTSVYTVVKPRTCRRAIIVTIRDRIVTGLKLLRNHGVQLRGSRFRIIRLFPTAPYSLFPCFPTISVIGVEHGSFRTL